MRYGWNDEIYPLLAIIRRSKVAMFDVNRISKVAGSHITLLITNHPNNQDVSYFWQRSKQGETYLQGDLINHLVGEYSERDVPSEKRMNRVDQDRVGRVVHSLRTKILIFEGIFRKNCTNHPSHISDGKI